MTDFDFPDPQPYDSAIDFAENPEARCACVVVADTSGSMKGEPIAQLNAGISAFATELRADRLAAKRVEVSIVTFGDVVKVESPFASADTFQTPTLSAGGATPMGAAICTALDLLDARLSEYRRGGVSAYRPVMLLLTDGYPTDPMDKAIRRLNEAEERRRMTLFPVGVEGADMALLGRLSSTTPLQLRGLQFVDMFRWLSTSLSAVSRSQPGQSVALTNPAAPGGWAMIP